MIPYKGNKERIAKEILNVMPSAAHFYDLFGGGGAVTYGASRLCEHGDMFHGAKWKVIHYNEILTGVCLLMQELLTGKFDFEKAEKTWISREDFHRLKDEPTAWGAYVRTCWSFGNGGDSYLYGKDVELLRRFQTILVNAKNPFYPNASTKEKRLLMCVAIREGLKSLAQELEHVFFRLQRLERLEFTNLDYRDVKIEPDAVVYCDIPYQGMNAEKRAYGVKFDHSAFYEWAAARDFPVYFSDYDCADPRFELVWEKETICKMAKKDGKAIHRTERLYWNKVSNPSVIIFP
jgi:site-specific DNA-adenine methylase